MAITYRLVKGSALSYGEIDSNFRQLDTAIVGLPDSAQVLDLIDSAHVQARQVVYSTSCLLYTSPSPRDRQKSRMPSSA